MLFTITKERIYNNKLIENISIQNVHKKKQYPISQEIIQTLSSLAKEIVRVWILSYMNIPQNEKADEIAKLSQTIAPIPNIQVPPHRYKKKVIKISMHKEFRRFWDLVPKFKKLRPSENQLTSGKLRFKNPEKRR